MNEVVTRDNVDYLKIYEYTDMSQFTLFDRNRCINKRHVKALKKDMLEYGTKRIPPILVDSISKILLDGQHRTMAYNELSQEGKITEPLRVIYMEAPEDEKGRLGLIIDLNVKGKHWTIRDFIHSGNTQGSPISKLINFCNDSNRPFLHKTYRNGRVDPNFRYGTAITIGKSDKKNITENSTVDITDEDFENGALYYSEIEKIVTALGLSNRIGSWLESFMQAWYSVRKDPAYSSMVDTIGIDAICEALTPSDFTTNKKEQWESIFKSLIWKVNSRL